ncbi:glycosyltransferase family 4 protein [Ferruginibacter sp. SUN106]|uniref:glycosyltransferase family 4 protein n=1 Tax=Ferruginibacter sp. SUN106 TaxID=2978348 RepID=UPI003D36DF26
MNAKNILFIIPAMQQGGAERVLSLMANYWAEKACTVSIMVFNEKRSFYQLHPGVNFYLLNSAANSFGVFNFIINNFKRAKNYFKYIKQINPDIIISFTDNANVYAVLYNRFKKKPLIIAQRTNPYYNTLPRFIRFLPRQIYKRAHAMVVQTLQTIDIYQNLKIPLPKIVKVIYNPLNEAIYKPRPEVKRTNIILAVGRLYNRDKHFDKLIDIFHATGDHQWQLHIAGEGPDRKILEDKIKLLQLSDKILLLGSISDLAPLYQTARIFVMTSEFEGFPNALCEAMANGCACISYDCATGPAEVIKNNSNGILIAPGKQAEFTRQLNDLMNDDNRIEQFSKAASNLREVLNEKKIMQQWEELIDKIIPLKN